MFNLISSSGASISRLIGIMRVTWRIHSVATGVFLGTIRLGTDGFYAVTFSGGQSGGRFENPDHALDLLETFCFIGV